MNENIKITEKIFNLFKDILLNIDISDSVKMEVIHNLSIPIHDQNNKEMNENTKKNCVICYKENITHIFKECGHLCICNKCSSMMNEIQTIQRCPICRKLGNTQKVFEV